MLNANKGVVQSAQHLHMARTPVMLVILINLGFLPYSRKQPDELGLLFFP